MGASTSFPFRRHINGCESVSILPQTANRIQCTQRNSRDYQQHYMIYFLSNSCYKNQLRIPFDAHIVRYTCCAVVAEFLCTTSHSLDEPKNINVKLIFMQAPIYEYAQAYVNTVHLIYKRYHKRGRTNEKYEKPINWFKAIFEKNLKKKSPQKRCRMRIRYM